MGGDKNMKYPLIEDERGSFQELAHDFEVKFGQLSLLKVKPNSKRGGHFHVYKNEWFCCIHGHCVMEIVNVLDESRRTVDLDELTKELVLIQPYESHTVINLGIEVCELLVIVSEPYNPKEPDTIKYEGK